MRRVLRCVGSAGGEGVWERGGVVGRREEVWGYSWGEEGVRKIGADLRRGREVRWGGRGYGRGRIRGKRWGAIDCLLN